MPDPLTESSLQVPASVVGDALAALEESPCTVWVCPGPDEPCRDYYTCNVCRSIQQLREVAA